MSTAPQPPRPPLPPPAPRSGSHVVAIALMVLALIILVSVVALWTGFRILSRTVHMQVNDAGGGKKEVSIKTPFGGIEVNKDQTASEASLDLPFYPGATPAPNHEDASVNMRFGNNALRIVVAKFQTTDTFNKVKDFYQERLTRQVGKFEPKDIEFDPSHWDNEEGNFIGKNKEGKTVFEIKKHDHMRVVALKDNGDGTDIELVRVSHGKEDTN